MVGAGGVQPPTAGCAGSAGLLAGAHNAQDAHDSGDAAAVSCTEKPGAKRGKREQAATIGTAFTSTLTV